MAIEKLNMETKDLSQEHIKQIQQLFPNAVTEINKNGKITLGIDFDVLKQELSNELIDEKQERYQMTWPDKKKAMLLANSKINASLRPLKEKSVDFENTKNIYIEGDNLDVLKLLRETYLNKVKMIYIDPPYNTGNDFVYNDNFAQSTDEYNANSGQYDEQGNRMVLNNESNGRFHTDWLNMMYPRLKIARDLLTDDGVIFISIDDSEFENLKKICDEIFGEQNFVACVVWERAYSPVNLKKHFSVSHDYILIYAKNINSLVCKGLKRTSEANERYSNPDNDSRGPWKSSDFSVGPRVEKNVYEIITPSGRSVFPPSGRCWRVTKEKYNELVKDNRVWFGEDGNNVPSTKRFLTEVKQGMTPMTIWKYSDVGHSQEAAQSLKKLFDGEMYFEYPKPVKLIKQLISLYDNEDCYVLDFFSGSATTAHAVIELNSEDLVHRKFILVQYPELTRFNEYPTICDIGEERIRRAGKKIKDELIEKKNNAGMLNDDVIDPDSLDIGFRVFKLDSSNMNDVYYNPNQTQKNLLDTTIDNIKLDRTGLDLLFQVTLELGVELSAKIEEKDILGKKCYFVNDNDIAACFDDDLTNELLTELAKTKPLYAVFKDSCFNNDSVAINDEQIFKTYSPSTKVKVL